MRKFTPTDLSDPNVSREELLLTPDSGFQMFFFPLRASDSSQLSSVPAELRPIVEHNRMVVAWDADDSISWPGNTELHDLVADIKLNGWQPCEKSYARGKVGSCAHGNFTLYGVWLAVETNVGDAYRGWTYEPPASPTKIEREKFSQDSAPYSPYYTDTAANLDQQDQIGIQLGNNVRIIQHITWKPLQKIDAELDLVIDFGNSRTCALVLEHVSPNSIGGGNANFSQICRPVPLAHSFYHSPLLTEDGLPHPAGLKHQSPDAASIVSSRFTLKRPEFRNFDPDSEIATQNPFTMLCRIPEYKTRTEGLLFWKTQKTELDSVEVRVPQMFVKNSPVCLGADMEEMVGGVTDIGKEFRRLHRDGVLVQQSSAKRFFWDSAPSHKEWSVVPNYGDENFGKQGCFEGVSGLMLRHIALPGSYAARPSISPSHANYPRRDTLTWTILSILETTHRSINSESWVKQAGVFQRRRIRNVIGTYPSGWTKTEIAEYQAKWQEAVDIYMTTHVQPGDKAVGLVMKLDESVASQIPILYSCMTRMATNKVGENWIQVNGVSGGPHPHPTLRIMNVDIGGGTSDVSIVEYMDKAPGMFVDLHATVLFKDSSTIAAGDVLLKKIVEQIVIGELVKKAGDPDAARVEFRRYFTKTANVAEKAKRVSLMISVLIPMATSLLRQRSDGKPLDFNPREAGVQPEVWIEFKAQFGLQMGHNFSFSVPPRDFDALIVDVFGVYLRSLAKHASAFDVHMLFVCGKPSEQPAIREMIERLVPVPIERIQFARGFKAGNWYPFSDDGDAAIRDAKTVTCVGAALDRAMSASMILNWKLTNVPRAGVRNMWGVMPIKGAEFDSQILSADQDASAAVVMNVTNRIGRKMFEGISCEPEPVYRLMWANGSKEQTTVRVVFDRVSQEVGGADSITIRSVADMQTGDDLTDQVFLSLYPLLQEQEPWQDTGELDLS
jgi:hypothetical protein